MKKIKIINQAEKLSEISDILKAKQIDLNILCRLWKNDLGPWRKFFYYFLDKISKASNVTSSRRQEF